MSRNQLGKTNTLIRLGLKYKIIITLAVGVTISIFSPQMSAIMFNKPEASIAIMLAGVLLIFESVNDFFESVFSGFKNFKYAGLLKNLQKSLKLILSVALILMGLAHIGALSGFIVAEVAILFASLFLVRKYRHVFSSKKRKIDKKIFITFGMWAFIGLLGGTIFTSVDSLMISMFMGVEDIGFYRIAFTWSFALMSIFPISGLVLFSYYSSSNRSETVSIYQSSLRYSFIMAVPLAFLMSAFSGSIVSIFYQESYMPAADALSILSFSAVPLIISSTLISYFVGIKKPEIPTKITGFSVVINIILNYFFILSMGIVGAAIATLISRILESAILISISSRIKKLTFHPSIIWKPLIAGLITYFATTFFIVSDLVTLILFGLVSLGIYISIMLIIRGIKREDIKIVRDIIGF